MTEKFGLLGKTLSHSYSPTLHAMLDNYEYSLFEVPPEELSEFVRSGSWHGLNVTVPYKKAVLPFCHELSPIARACGSVNTLIRRPNGSIFGDNTDAFGFSCLLERLGISPSGKKAVVLGSGGASAAVCAVLRQLSGAVTVISRTGKCNYVNLYSHQDAAVIVNATPVGMYPENGKSPIDLSLFPKCEAVFDLVYNPARTALLLQAESLSIPHVGGLPMLCGQALRSSELFTGKTIPVTRVNEVERALSKAMENIILIGMPGCGKTAVAAALGRVTGRPVIDTDELLAQHVGMSAGEYLALHGETAFRQAETQVLRDVGKRSGTVIATGGGCVTVSENYPLLRQNGVIVWLQRDINKLATAGRPLSENTDLRELYARRAPLYQRFASLTADNSGTPEEAAERILCKLS